MTCRGLKWSEIWDSVGSIAYTREYMCNFWNFGQMVKFHTQIRQFWKWARISETTVCRAKTSSISTPWGRKRVYVQLLELWPMVKFHAQIWQFWKLPIPWSENKFNVDPSGVERESMQLLYLCQWPRFMSENKLISDPLGYKERVCAILEL